MGHIGDKIRPESLHTAQFPGHFIQALGDLVEALVGRQLAHRLDADGKVPGDHFVCRLGDFLYRPLHRDLPAQIVNGCHKGADQHHIHHSDLGSRGDLLLGEGVAKSVL